MTSIITVFIENHKNTIEPVSYELLGKANEIAKENNMKVCGVLVENSENSLDLDELEYLVDYIDIYKYNEKLNLNVLDYKDSLKFHIEEYKPMIVLVGATPLGRSFAPRVAAYFKTGMTADCTELDFDVENGLVQIRPAYGGDVKARIITPKHCPQMATVRAGIMEKSLCRKETKASIRVSQVDSFDRRIEVIKRKSIEKLEVNLEKANIVVLAGNGIKYSEELEMIKKLALLLKGEWAVTRPLVEGGLAKHDRQVGASGKTIRPKLVLAFAVSGTNKTFSGIEKAKKIVAINNDEKAPIFKNADLGILGDWKVICEEMINRLNN